MCLCLPGALSWGIGNVVARSAGIAGGLSLTVWSALVVPVPLLGLSVLVDGPDAIAAALTRLSWQAAVSTLYTAGLASLVGYGIFNVVDEALFTRPYGRYTSARSTSQPG